MSAVLVFLKLCLAFFVARALIGLAVFFGLLVLCVLAFVVWVFLAVLADMRRHRSRVKVPR
jgi:hypothetical protein